MINYAISKKQSISFKNIFYVTFFYVIQLLWRNRTIFKKLGSHRISLLYIRLFTFPIHERNLLSFVIHWYFIYYNFPFKRMKELWFLEQLIFQIYIFLIDKILDFALMHYLQVYQSKQIGNVDYIYESL